MMLKMKSSGYTSSTIDGVVLSGVTHYHRKLRIELEGGPPVNQRLTDIKMARRRAKMTSTTNWFSKRRRGGLKERCKKENSWRNGEGDRPRGMGRETRESKRSPCPPPSNPATNLVVNQPGQPKDLTQETEAILLVAYSVGGCLARAVQKAEDNFSSVVNARRIRIVEKGGLKLSNLLCRSDPGASARTCRDPKCVTCGSRTWYWEQEKEARRQGAALPKVLSKPGGGSCRREGVLYTLQCLDCALEGAKAVYTGESSMSCRQRHAQHSSALTRGDTSSAMVWHAVQAHGGQRPRVLASLTKIEHRPMYRAIREAVAISNMGSSGANLNRCGEWGTKRLPTLHVTGGDEDIATNNPNPEWSRNMLERIREGGVKRVRLVSQGEEKPVDDNNDVENVTSVANLDSTVDPTVDAPDVIVLDPDPTSALDNPAPLKRLRSGSPPPPTSTTGRSQHLIQPTIISFLTRSTTIEVGLGDKTGTMDGRIDRVASIGSKIECENEAAVSCSIQQEDGHNRDANPVTHPDPPSTSGEPVAKLEDVVHDKKKEPPVPAPSKPVLFGSTDIRLRSRSNTVSGQVATRPKKPKVKLAKKDWQDRKTLLKEQVGTSRGGGVEPNPWTWIWEKPQRRGVASPMILASRSWMWGQSPSREHHLVVGSGGLAHLNQSLEQEDRQEVTQRLDPALYVSSWPGRKWKVVRPGLRSRMFLILLLSIVTRPRRRNDPPGTLTTWEDTDVLTMCCQSNCVYFT